MAGLLVFSFLALFEAANVCLTSAFVIFDPPKVSHELEYGILKLIRSYEDIEFKETYTEKQNVFEWKDCGGPGTVVHIKGLSVDPLPIRAPGMVNISVNYTVDESLTSTVVEVDAKVYKRSGSFWIDVCPFARGKCHIDNICPKTIYYDLLRDGFLGLETIVEAWKDVFGENEEDSMRLSSTSCNYQKGDYFSPPSQIPLPKIPSGQYKVKISLKTPVKTLACVSLQFEVKR